LVWWSDFLLSSLTCWRWSCVALLVVSRSLSLLSMPRGWFPTPFQWLHCLVRERVSSNDSCFCIEETQFLVCDIYYFKVVY